MADNILAQLKIKPKPKLQKIINVEFKKPEQQQDVVIKTKVVDKRDEGFNRDAILEKIKQLNGYYFVENELAKSLGYNNDKIQVGVSAQEVEKVLPEIVTQAPVGKEYKTVWYEKLTPLLIEGVKEQQNQIDELKILVASLMKK
jgi:hypothetical protein